jgi:hypothetical protein
MRGTWVLALCLGLLAASQGSAIAAESLKLELSDGKYPLWEIRPLDRRVYVVSLDGTWKKPMTKGARFQLAVRFPDGSTYSHRPINDALFERGEMRFMLPEYRLVHSGATLGGTISLYVTERATRTSEPEVISNSLDITWPLKRAVVRRAPPTKYTPEPPVDAFPQPGDVPPVPKEESVAPRPKRIEGPKVPAPKKPAPAPPPPPKKVEGAPVPAPQEEPPKKDDGAAVPAPKKEEAAPPKKKTDAPPPRKDGGAAAPKDE